MEGIISVLRHNRRKEIMKSDLTKIRDIIYKHTNVTSKYTEFDSYPEKQFKFTFFTVPRDSVEFVERDDIVLFVNMAYSEVVRIVCSLEYGRFVIDADSIEEFESKLLEIISEIKTDCDDKRIDKIVESRKSEKWKIHKP